MAVSIDQINVEENGPISGLQLELGEFNLIYGHNERGKTFLVEFLIRSLFKNHSDWSLRSSQGRGKVVLSGLSETPLVLMPSSKMKLEDYLLQDEPGMPEQISHLLVVKGAELDFSDNGSVGIDKQALKRLLSGQGLLDVIQNQISKTVRDASIEDGQITGSRRGEIKNQAELLKRKQGLDMLFEDIEATYSDGERNSLELDINDLKTQIAEQELAKRHQAYLINQVVEETKASLIPEDELGGLDDKFKEYKKTEQSIARLTEELEQLEQAAVHYEWLEQAIATYEQRGSKGANKLSIRYPAIILVLLILAIVLSLLGQPLGAAVAILGAIIAGWLYWREVQTAIERAIDVDEVKRLEAEFQNRFDKPLTGLPVMQEEKRSIEDAYHAAKGHRRMLADEEDNLALYRAQVAAKLETLTGQIPPQGEWGATIRALLQDQKRLSEKLGEQKIAAAALAVESPNYRSEPAAVDYEPSTIVELTAKRDALEGNLKEKTSELENLKHRICQETGDDISTDWNMLIRSLQTKREEVVAEYRQLTAIIVAGILVNQALDTIRTQEDEKIRQKLSSPLVSKPIELITGRYSGVRYDNGQLFVIDAYGEFPLGELSTGAREQVLLGLRLGFAAQIFGQGRLFLLLDDAFQHADWGRRKRLLKQMVTLAQDGWQIIYFTMDDHIRQLFDTAGNEHFGAEYHSFSLNDAVG